ncbi:MAG: zf-HC2 domain-containing protein [Pseudomonadales bacterium]
MLTCQEVTAKASQKVDGELGFRDRIAVRAHLMMCVKCRLYFKQFKALVTSLSGGNHTEPEPPSPEFVQRVVSDLNAARDASSHSSESR